MRILPVYLLHQCEAELKMTIKSTEQKYTTSEGSECRLWTGTTSDGLPVTAFVRSVVVQAKKDDEAGQRALDFAVGSLTELPPQGSGPDRRVQRLVR